MPTSEAKIKANRTNSRLSTGPHSPRGKDKSRGNAIKHGGYCRSLLPGEKIEDFETLLANAHEHFRAEGALEKKCVYHIARCFWILDRIALAEQARIAGQIWKQAESTWSPEDNQNSPAEMKPHFTDVHHVMAEYLISDSAPGSFDRARAQIRREMDYYIDKLKDLKSMRRNGTKQ